MNKPNSITPDDLKDLLNQPPNNQWPQGKRGGFRKINELSQDKCNAPEHNPPGNIYLEGGTYEYTCPVCGEVTIVNVPKITM